MTEKAIEKKLREEVKKKGGIALKLAAPYFNGMPDRLIILPGGITRFAELKSTGKTQTPLQITVMKKLQKLGHKVAVIDDQETLTTFLNSI